MASKFLASIVAGSLSLIGINVYAESADVTFLNELDQETIEEVFGNAGQLRGMRELPVGRLLFVEADNEYLAMSENGRFVFRGEILDLWNRRKIESLEDARANERVPLSTFGLNIEEDLKPISIGNKEIAPQAIAFVDPSSEHTTSLIERIIQYEKDVHIQLIMLPLLGGEDAIEASRALMCHKDTNQQLEAMLSRDFTRVTKQLDETCGVEEVQLANALRPVFSINGLPFVVRNDGLTARGAPEDVKNWLERP